MKVKTYFKFQTNA